jgi:two-component system, LytTR family, response regulator
MKKLQALIVDDEKLSRENLKTLISEYCEGIEVIAEANSAKAANTKILELEPDVIFLDINMPKESGFDLLQSLPENDYMIVFVTAHNEYGIQAVKVDAVDYLLKPIDINELKDAEKKLIKRWKNYRQKPSINQSSLAYKKIIVNHSQGFSIIEIENIVRLEGSRNYTKIFLNDNSEIISSKNLKEFEDILNSNFFYRIHKSHLINLKYLKEYSNVEGGMAIMSDNSRIIISRRRFQEFIDKLRDFSLYVK